MCEGKGNICLDCLELDLDGGDSRLEIKFRGDETNLFCLVEEIRNLVRDVNAAKSGKQ